MLALSSELQNYHYTITNSSNVLETQIGPNELVPLLFYRFMQVSGEQYDIEVDPSVPLRKTPCSPVQIHQQGTFNSHWQRCKLQASSSQLTMPHHESTVLSLLIKTTWQAWQGPVTDLLGSFQLYQSYRKEPFITGPLMTHFQVVASKMFTMVTSAMDINTFN